MAQVTEHDPYSYISQSNENSCLTIPKTNTDFVTLQNLVDRVAAENQATKEKDLLGAKGYVVKFTNNGTTLYAVKRSTSTWKASYPKKFITFSLGMENCLACKIRVLP